MPGLLNGHLHGVGANTDLGFGMQPVLPGTFSHALGAQLREFLRYGVTTLRGDDPEFCRGGVWIEVLRMVHHGLSVRGALAGCMSTAAHALGLDDLGSIAPGKLADLVVLDGDPVEEPEVLGDPERFWLVLQEGTAVAGAAVEVSLADLGSGS